jgi:hypothetical protein
MFVSQFESKLNIAFSLHLKIRYMSFNLFWEMFVSQLGRKLNIASSLHSKTRYVSFDLFWESFCIGQNNMMY